MAMNVVLTDLIKDRVIKAFHAGPGKTEALFHDGSKLLINSAAVNSLPLPVDCQIVAVEEDEATVSLHGSVGSIFSVQITVPGESLTVYDAAGEPEYQG